MRFSPKPIGAAFGLGLPALRGRIVRNLRRVYGKRGALREQLDAVETLSNYAACFAEAIASGRNDVTALGITVPAIESAILALVGATWLLLAHRRGGLGRPGAAGSPSPATA